MLSSVAMSAMRVGMPAIAVPRLTIVRALATDSAGLETFIESWVSEYGDAATTSDGAKFDSMFGKYFNSEAVRDHSAALSE